MGSQSVHISVWIYKYPFVRALIERVANNEQPSLSSVWFTGKIFGYSDLEISSYIDKHNLST